VLGKPTLVNRGGHMEGKQRQFVAQTALQTALSGVAHRRRGRRGWRDGLPIRILLGGLLFGGWLSCRCRAGPTLLVQLLVAPGVCILLRRLHGE
jgi:hypothetical protein